MPDAKKDPPITVEIDDCQVAGLRMDLIKRQVTITLQCAITPEFMAIRDRIGMLGFTEQPTLVTITGKQRELGM